MARLNEILTFRLKNKESSKNKITASLAERQDQNFSNFFKLTKLSNYEKEAIKSILNNYKEKTQDTENDEKNLLTLTSEIKSITNQALMLHGERIKKAQHILKKYKEGAFSAWLIATYGNRQTPYNFLQYYEFYASLSESLRPKMEAMPRQVIYTLASRTGEKEKKEDIIRSYSGETKQELLSLIRKIFPLPNKDKRNPNFAEQSIISLKKTYSFLEHSLFSPTKAQKEKIDKLLSNLKMLLEQKTERV